MSSRCAVDDPWVAMERLSPEWMAKWPCGPPPFRAININSPVSENLTWMLFGYEPGAEQHLLNGMWKYDMVATGMHTKVEKILGCWEARQRNLGTSFAGHKLFW